VNSDSGRSRAGVVAREQREPRRRIHRLVGFDAPLVASVDEELLERALEKPGEKRRGGPPPPGRARRAARRARAGGVLSTSTDDGPGFAPDHTLEVRRSTQRPGGLGLGRRSPGRSCSCTAASSRSRGSCPRCPGSRFACRTGDRPV